MASIYEELHRIAIKDKCKTQIKELLKNELDYNLSDLEKKDSAAILIDAKNNKFVNSNLSFVLKDVKIIEKWSTNGERNRITDRLYKLNLSKNIFLFNKYHSSGKQNMILAGVLLENNNELRFMTAVLQAKELPNFNIKHISQETI